jgi:hypothetical protein
MEQSPYWKANSLRSAIQEIPRILRDPQVHCRVHKSHNCKFYSRWSSSGLWRSVDFQMGTNILGEHTISTWGPPTRPYGVTTQKTITDIEQLTVIK